MDRANSSLVSGHSQELNGIQITKPHKIHLKKNKTVKFKQTIYVNFKVNSDKNHRGLKSNCEFFFCTDIPAVSGIKLLRLSNSMRYFNVTVPAQVVSSFFCLFPISSYRNPECLTQLIFLWL